MFSEMRKQGSIDGKQLFLKNISWFARGLIDP